MSSEQLIAELERLQDELDREYMWWATANLWFSLGFPSIAMTMLLRRAMDEVLEILPMAKGIGDAFAAAVGDRG